MPIKSGNTKELTPRQMKLAKERAKGKTYAAAAIAAGYPPAHAKQSGFQAMQQMRGRVPEILDRYGLSEETLVKKYLKPLLSAEQTRLFQRDEGIERVSVEDNGTRHAALRTALELHGSYAPKEIQQEVNMRVKVVVVDMPRPEHSEIALSPIIREGDEE